MKSTAKAVPVEQQSEVGLVSAFADLRCGIQGQQYAFQHIVLVSLNDVHVAMRCNADPTVALIAVAPRSRSVGSIVSEARGRLSQRTSEPA